MTEVKIFRYSLYTKFVLSGCWYTRHQSYPSFITGMGKKFLALNWSMAFLIRPISPMMLHPVDIGVHCTIASIFLYRLSKNYPRTRQYTFLFLSSRMLIWSTYSLICCSHTFTSVLLTDLRMLGAIQRQINGRALLIRIRIILIPGQLSVSKEFRLHLVLKKAHSDVHGWLLCLVQKYLLYPLFLSRHKHHKSKLAAILPWNFVCDSVFPRVHSPTLLSGAPKRTKIEFPWLRISGLWPTGAASHRLSSKNVCVPVKFRSWLHQDQERHVCLSI